MTEQNGQYQTSEIEQQLKAPFPKKDILWRVQQAGMGRNNQPYAMVLAYVDARAIMDRLDKVVGFFNWADDYRHETNGVMCWITVHIDGIRITRCDGSQETEIEAFKGGISKAFVRCAVKFGIGRYLYNLPVTFAETSTDKQKGWHRAKANDTTFYWQEPTLPDWALPEHEQGQAKGQSPPREKTVTKEDVSKIKHAREKAGLSQDEVKAIMKESPFACEHPPTDMLSKHTDTLILRIQAQAKGEQNND